MVVFVELIGVSLEAIIRLIIIDKLSDIKKKDKTFFIKVICVCLNVFIWYYIKEIGSWKYSLGTILDMLNFSLYTIIQKRQNFFTMFASVMASIIMNAFLGLVAAIIVYFTINVEKSNSLFVWVMLTVYVLRFLILYLLVLIEKRFNISHLFKKRNVQLIIVIIGLLIEVMRQPIYLYKEITGNNYVQISIAIIAVAVVFCIMWIVDWHFAERERRLLWEDNIRMSERLHKSKEIIPLLSNVLEKIKISNNSEDFNKLIEEVHKLCSDQIYESENEDMHYKSFPTTGIHILDEQIKLYGKEAASKGINFDIFVNIMMSDALKKHDISNFDFLQLLGNLMRNAFRAIEKKDDSKGNILLIMGCVNDILEVEIYDDGVLFPIRILNEFGKKGNTEGGTGYGIAEILDVISRYHASYRLTEYDDNMAFSKGISIIWNSQNERWLDTHRNNQISKESIFE